MLWLISKADVTNTLLNALHAKRLLLFVLPLLERSELLLVIYVFINFSRYVRCPCNCLLICKAASTRIACPRTNCRRVITLGHREPQGSAVRAPTGSCRVSCVYCHEVFLFNTMTNSLANCPHCKNSLVLTSVLRILLFRSSVGGLCEKRARNWTYAVVISLILTLLMFYPIFVHVSIFISIKKSCLGWHFLGSLGSFRRCQSSLHWHDGQVSVLYED